MASGSSGPSTRSTERAFVAGFRGFSDGFSYVILRGTQAEPSLIAHDRLPFPKNETWPYCLAWLRRELIEIMGRHDVSAAALKAIEGNARRVSRQRLQVEAVIQEVLHSECRIECLSRVKAQIRKAIPGFNQPARYLHRVLDDLNALEQLRNERFQEATLAALSVLPEDV